MTRDEIIAVIVSVAQTQGLVPYELLGGAIAESGLNPTAWRQGAWPDWSAGLFQQTVAFADEGDRTASPENVALIQRLYFDPEHAATVAARKFKGWRYDPDVSALQAWCAYNLPASYRLWPDVPNVEQRENYRRGLAEAERLLSAIEEPTMTAARLRVTDAGVRLRSGPGTDSAVLATLAADTLVAPLSDHAWREVQAAGQRGWIAADLLADVPTDDSGSAETPQPAQNRKFDPTIPTELQRQDWTCSIRSVMWMLKSIGIAVTPDEAQDAMSPRYVTSDVGLRDASGAGIVEVLRDHWGVEAVNFGHISFDEAMSLAGTGPLAIGLRNWGGPGHGHWSAVRGRGDGTLVLANPAGTGPIYGQQTLDRQQFDARGPASAVWVNVNGT